MRLETNYLEVEEASAASRLYPSGMYVRTVVSCSGGFPENKGRRTLELLLVQSIVAQNGGHFRWVLDEAGSAKQAEILLPSIGALHAGAPADGNDPPATILLAEEEDSVRRMMRACLVRAGYSVLEARTGADAEALARLSKDPIDLLITDAVTSEKSGTELAGRLQQLWPKLPTLFVTGYRHDFAERHCVEAAILPKPFVAHELLRQVRILLNRAQAV